MIQKEARLGEENERAKREKRSAEEALENLIRFRAANDDRNSQITELHQKLGNERKVRDTLNEQIRKIQQKNDELRREIEQVKNVHFPFVTMSLTFSKRSSISNFLKKAT